jgi:UDP-2,4-diacetamido-2,4,6-trideoxy-beta-L-altropyranose hydrolase
MRCATLADALRARGGQVRFVCRHAPETLRSQIERRGHEVVMLPAAPAGANPGSDLAHASWLGVSQAHDAEETLRAAAGQSWDCVIVDHYGIDLRWERAMRGVFGTVMVIDDLADRDHDCELLLDQNLVRSLRGRYAARVPGDCVQLLGPEHALLNESYAELHDSVPARSQVDRILIFFGGSDRLNLTGRTLEAVLALSRQDIAVDVVLSLGGLDAERIEALAARRSNIRCHRHLPTLSPLMAAADLAIGSFGATSWERLCLGLPTIAVRMAMNQEQVAAALHEAGMVVSLGHSDDVSSADIARELERIMSSVDLAEWSRRCAQLCDGRGTQRVVSVLWERVRERSSAACRQSRGAR